MISYEELLLKTIDRLPTVIDDKKAAWRTHIEIALELKEDMRTNRMLIAEVAERSCLIYKGGDRRSPEFEETIHKLTLKRFCHDAGLQYTTVNTWCLVKRRIFSKLSENDKTDFHVTAAIEASHFFKARGYFGMDGKEPSAAEVKEVYQRRCSPSERKMRQERIKKYLRQAHYYLAIKGNWTLYGDAERDELREYCANMLRTLHQHESILKKKK